ncbi:hypothetical protein D3C71_1466210 [compost metagenome]
MKNYLLMLGIGSLLLTSCSGVENRQIIKETSIGDQKVVETTDPYGVPNEDHYDTYEGINFYAISPGDFVAGLDNVIYNGYMASGYFVTAIFTDRGTTLYFTQHTSRVHKLKIQNREVTLKINTSEDVVAISLE